MMNELSEKEKEEKARNNYENEKLPAKKMKLRESRLKEFDFWSCRHFPAYMWTFPFFFLYSLLNFPCARLSLKLKFYYHINKFNGIVLINK